MRITDWKWRVYLFMRASDITPQVKDIVAHIFVDNGGIESLANESKMFDQVIKFSQSGDLPAIAYGISFVAKSDMKDAFVNFLQAYPNARYVVSANTELPNWEDGELIATNFDVTPNGQIVDWSIIIKFLENEFGLIPITEEI